MNHPQAPYFGLDDAAVQRNLDTRKAGRVKFCAGFLIVLGLICFLAASFVPGLINYFIAEDASQLATLTQANQSLWTKVPSDKFDITIDRKYSLFNVTNYNEVTFLNADPQFQEIGPFTYREMIEYSNLYYVSEQDQRFGFERPVVYADKETQFQLDPSQGPLAQKPGLLDSPIYVSNQGAFKIGFASENEPVWKTASRMLKDVVLDGLGSELMSSLIHKRISLKKLPKIESINTVLLPKNPIQNQEILSQVFSDTSYGLSNPENFVHWDSLLSQSSKEDFLAWQWELKTYFGLTPAQIEELTQSWRSLVEKQRTTLLQSIPSNSDYQTVTGIAYWQWASGYLSKERNGVSPKASVSLEQNSLLKGTPEISYFMAEVFDKKASDPNKQVLKDVQFFRSQASNGQNFEHLFFLPENGEDPPANSLFNVTTIQKLCHLGKITPNIIKGGSKLVLNETFNLVNDWTLLSQTLGLIDERHAYVLWLWLDHALESTYARVAESEEGSSVLLQKMGQAGAKAFQKNLKDIKVNTPMLKIAEELVKSLDGQPCDQIYGKMFNLTTSQAISLCNSENFSFSDPFKSAQALTNIYLYGDKLNSDLFLEFKAAFDQKDPSQNQFGFLQKMLILANVDQFEIPALNATQKLPQTADKEVTPKSTTESQIQAEVKELNTTQITSETPKNPQIAPKEPTPEVQNPEIPVQNPPKIAKIPETKEQEEEQEPKKPKESKLKPRSAKKEAKVVEEVEPAKLEEKLPSLPKQSPQKVSPQATEKEVEVEAKPKKSDEKTKSASKMGKKLKPREKPEEIVEEKKVEVIEQKTPVIESQEPVETSEATKTPQPSQSKEIPTEITAPKQAEPPLKAPSKTPKGESKQQAPLTLPLQTSSPKNVTETTEAGLEILKKKSADAEKKELAIDAAEAMFLRQTQKNMSGVNDFLHGSESQFPRLIFNLQRKMFEDFSKDGSNCSSGLKSWQMCSFSFLTFNQWLNSSTSDKFTESSQTEKAFEFGEFSKNAQLSPNTLSSDPKQLQKDLQKLQDPRIFMQVLEGKSTSESLNSLQEYAQYVAINFGLGGLLTKQTPRQIIEGYTDSTVQKINSQSLLEGGDATIDANLSLQYPLSDSKKQRIAFFTGEDEAEVSRQVARVNDLQVLNVPVQAYTSLNSVKTEYIAPEPVLRLIEGTDGLALAPGLPQNPRVSVYSDYLRQNVPLQAKERFSEYDFIETDTYAEKDQLYEAPELLLPGSVNMTNVLQADAIWTKPNFEGLSQEVQRPQIQSTQGESKENLEAFKYGVAAQTGKTIFFEENGLTSFVSHKGQPLLKSASSSSDKSQLQMWPLVNMKRTMQLTNDQVHSYFRDQKFSVQTKWILFGTCLGFGVLYLGIGIGLIFWYLKLQKDLNAVNADHTETPKERKIGPPSDLGADDQLLDQNEEPLANFGTSQNEPLDPKNDPKKRQMKINILQAQL